MNRHRWQDDAACSGYVDLFGEETVSRWFFLERGDSAETAREICAECPVQEECLEYAINGDGPWRDHGIWGGLTADERKALRRQRGTPAPARRQRAACGTDSGYNRHRAGGEKACPACLQAHRLRPHKRSQAEDAA